MIIKRDNYLSKLIRKRNNGLIKIITGIRRCGKSFLLFELFRSYLLAQGISEQNIIALSLEDDASARYRNPLELGEYIRSRIVDYGINNEFPDREVDFNNLDSYEPYVLFRTNDDSIRFVSSQIIFTDGSSSDIRISNIIETID